jgi:hypothetical protein
LRGNRPAGGILRFCNNSPSIARGAAAAKPGRGEVVRFERRPRRMCFHRKHVQELQTSSDSCDGSSAAEPAVGLRSPEGRSAARPDTRSAATNGEAGSAVCLAGRRGGFDRYGAIGTVAAGTAVPEELDLDWAGAVCGARRAGFSGGRMGSRHGTRGAVYLSNQCSHWFLNPILTVDLIGRVAAPCWPP